MHSISIALIGFFSDLRCFSTCCFDHKCSMLCCVIPAKKLLRNTNRLEKSEPSVMALYRLSLFIAPLILGIMRIVSIEEILRNYTSPKPWLTNKSAANCFIISFEVMVALTSLQMFLFYAREFSSVKIERFTIQRGAGTGVRTAEEQSCWQRCYRANQNLFKNGAYSVACEIATILADISFLTVNIAYFYLALIDDCFEVGSEKDQSVKNQYLTKEQTSVLFPAVLLLMKFITAFLEMCKDFTNNNPRSKLQLLKDICQPILTPATFFTSLFAFALWSNGFCLHSSLSLKCPHANFSIEVSSHVRYAFESHVIFPKIGSKSAKKLIEIRYTTYLRDHLGTNSSYTCWPSEPLSNRTLVKTVTHCETETFNSTMDFSRTFEVSKSSHLGSGIILQWPCYVTAKLHKIRQGVECRYRVKIQIDKNSDFLFNYDYVYKLPDSASERSLKTEWTKIGIYEPFNSIVSSSSSKSFEDFRKLFDEVDKKLANMTFSAQSIDLITEKPQILKIECNRSCGCYECVADIFVKRPEICFLVCPDRPLDDYNKYLKKEFCNSKLPDKCHTVWKPIVDIASQFDMDSKELMSTQSPPNITVLLGDKIISAVMNSSVILPPPSM